MAIVSNYDEDYNWERKNKDEFTFGKSSLSFKSSRFNRIIKDMLNE